MVILAHQDSEINDLLKVQPSPLAWSPPQRCYLVVLRHSYWGNREKQQWAAQLQHIPVKGTPCFPSQAKNYEAFPTFDYASHRMN